MWSNECRSTAFRFFLDKHELLPEIQLWSAWRSDTNPRSIVQHLWLPISAKCITLERTFVRVYREQYVGKSGHLCYNGTEKSEMGIYYGYLLY